MSTSVTSLRREMALVAAGAGSVTHRADALLACLRKAVPFTAAWISVRDPETHVHRRVASDGDVDSLARYFALPHADEEVERLGLNRYQPPVAASALPVPLAETLAWGEYLLPAGFYDGVTMALFTDDDRHLGFLSLLTADPGQRMTSYVGLLADLRPLVVEALDRLPSFGEAARLTGDPLGAVVVTRTGRTVPLPGLPSHPVLAEGSAALGVARRHASGPGAASAFLAPWGGRLLRIDVLDCRDETADHLCALALAHAADEAVGLGWADLRLLGALVEGWGDDRVRASHALPDPARSVDDLARCLGVPSKEALVRHAARRGLHLPPLLWE